MVAPPGVEPRLTNYLLHTGYKSAVLPLNYRAVNTIFEHTMLHLPSKDRGNVFKYGRRTENRTLICWLKASYFSR